MSDDLEKRLRAALRPVDPGEEFTRGVLARIADEAARPAQYLSRAAVRWTTVALAASIVLTVVAAHQWRAQRTQRGLEARQQLLEALQLTSNKLDVAYRAVNEPRSDVAASNPDGGA
jgi:hypothetical protein